VNGSANAPSMGLKIFALHPLGRTDATPGGNYFLYQAALGTSTPCDGFYNIPNAPGNISFSGWSPDQTSVTLTASNLTPSVYCVVGLVLENTGSVPVTVSVAMYSAGFNGMCVAYQIDCYGVFTFSGIGTDGQIYWFGAPNFGTPTDYSANFVTLNPGGTYTDVIGVDLPPFSDDSTPSSAVFTLVYTASAGT